MHEPPPFPIDEEERLRALRRYRILDTEPEPQFDRIVKMAQRRFDVPLALVSFGAGQDRKRHAIIQHIVALARGLDMTVTAEGVETECEAALASAAGCTSLQGHYFGAPMPASAIAERLRQGRPAA
jgi:hypothetical protein